MKGRYVMMQGAGRRIGTGEGAGIGGAGKAAWLGSRTLALLVSVALVLGSLLFGGVGDAAASQRSGSSQPVLRIGYFPSLAGGAVPAIGSHFGWFKKLGLQVTFVPFTAAPAASAALVGGSIDMTSIGMNAAINGLAGYARIVGLDDYDNDDFLLSTPGSGIQSLSQLRGKSIGYTEGTNGQIVLQLALDKAHLTLKDVNAINLEPTAIVSSFDAGKIDAASIYLPFEAAITSAVSGTHVLARASTFLGPSAIPLVWVASNRALSSEQPEIEKFLQVLAMVRNYRATHLRESASIVAQFTRAPSIKPFLEQMSAEGWPNSKETLAFYKAGGMQRAWTRIDGILVQAGIAKTALSPSKVLDLGLDESVLEKFTKS